MGNVTTQSIRTSERRVLAEYEQRDEESLEKSIAEAFARIGVDLMARERMLGEVVDMDALRDLYADLAVPVRTTLSLYDYPVTITTDRVLIHGEATTQA